LLELAAELAATLALMPCDISKAERGYRLYDAIGELRGLRLGWQREYRNPQFSVPQPTMNFGCIHGGDNPNRICGQCSLEFDLRPLPGMDPEVLRAAIRQKLEPLAERHQVKIDYAPLFPAVPPFEQPEDTELARVATSSQARLKISPVGEYPNGDSSTMERSSNRRLIPLRSTRRTSPVWW
jgi:acetylornithine deacetylase/succinyl-diaminopimelate desuccinylase-like protein